MERWKSGAKMFDREGKCMTITSAQEYLIKQLYEELGMDYDEDEIASMTKKDASKAIQELLDMKEGYR